eukprot:2627656-Alexandrium_andersonii.AAC.1
MSEQLPRSHMRDGDLRPPGALSAPSAPPPRSPIPSSSLAGSGEHSGEHGGCGASARNRVLQGTTRPAPP